MSGARLDDRFRKRGGADTYIDWTEVDYLRDCGVCDAEIARRLKVKPESLIRAEYRRGER